jgi:hypothetical protein
MVEKPNKQKILVCKHLTITHGRDIISNRDSRGNAYLLLVHIAKFVDMGSRPHSEAQLVNKFPAFYGIQMFTIVFTRLRKWPLSGDAYAQSSVSL